MTKLPLPLPLLAALLVITTSGEAGAAGGRVDFLQKVRPILSNNCFHCHGPDAGTREADLRLDTSEGLFTPLDGVTPVVPGKSSESEVYLRIISTDRDEIMPPPKTHKTLKPEEIELVKQWIDQGAEFRAHWAYTAPVKPKIPSTGGIHPIDAFLSQKWAAHELNPEGPTSRETLLRRVTFDLTGLPPSIAEIDQFLADDQPGAFERVVDRLLGSPQYGEHMARYWLDAARYADTHGLHLDNERSMWPYRDWVVRAFNANMPFDQFTRWQLAGDLVPPAGHDPLIASGFNRCNVTTSEGGSINEELLVRYAVDRTTAMSEIFMGTTAGCAVCHDHKFDPVSQKEFYQLYAFFNSAADPAMDGNKLLTEPILTITKPEEEAHLASLKTQIEKTQRDLDEKVGSMSYTDPASLAEPPAPKQVEAVWFDDDLPPNSKANANGGTPALQWSSAENGGIVFSGSRAIKRTATEVAQDYFTGISPAIAPPADGKVFVHAYLDPSHLPEAIMVQFHTNTWSHRAVWGDIEKVTYGKVGTTERLRIGNLPKAGEWVKLEFNIKQLKLPAGAQFTGFAFTQFGGTVYWDQLGISYTDDPLKDPERSQLAWEKKHQGTKPADYPADLQEIFRSVKPADRKPEHVKRLRDFYLSKIHRESREALASIVKPLEKLRLDRENYEKALPATFIMRDMAKPRPAHILVRGQYDKTAEEVQPATPAFLPPLNVKDRRATRLDLAEWLLTSEHPLTTRVTVNRLWQQFFGTGIVGTPADFGSQGEPPTHQELLDWLAVDFREHQWDIKRLVRLIVTSSAYQRDSKATPQSLDRDPYNRYLARGPRFRLDAEALRDQALKISGLLVSTMGGKGVKPYQPENIWEPVGFVGSNTREYRQDHGTALYRRSLYTFLKRTAPPPSMSNFDAPNREQSCTRRERSNTPLQALQLLNDVQYFEAARAFAERIIKEGGTQSPQRIAWGFRCAVGREPSADELQLLEDAFAAQKERYTADPTSALQVITVGESKPDEKLPPEELAAWTLVANLLLNLDETLTKN